MAFQNPAPRVMSNPPGPIDNGQQQARRAMMANFLQRRPMFAPANLPPRGVMPVQGQPMQPMGYPVTNPGGPRTY